MRPNGRRCVALVSMFGGMALLCLASAVSAQTSKTESDLTTKGVGSKEVSLGDLVADAVRAAAKSDAAFVAATSFEEVTIPKGSFKVADVLRAVLGKDDTIVIVKLTGDQLRRALETGLYNYPTFNSGFLQVSGLTVNINPDAEKERRVVSVKVGDDALEAGKTYRIAMPAPLASGSLGYYKVWKKSDIEKDTERTLEAAITAYLNEHKTITKGDERLVFKGK